MDHYPRLEEEKLSGANLSSSHVYRCSDVSLASLGLAPFVACTRTEGQFSFVGDETLGCPTRSRGFWIAASVVIPVILAFRKCFRLHLHR